MIKDGTNIDIEVALLRQKALEMFNNTPLPISVKAMIANEFSLAFAERERAHMETLFSHVKINEKGDGIDGTNTGAGETETLSGTTENIQIR